MTTSVVGLKKPKKTVMYAKISPQTGEPRDIAGNTEEGEEDKLSRKQRLFRSFARTFLNWSELNFDTALTQCTVNNLMPFFEIHSKGK